MLTYFFVYRYMSGVGASGSVLIFALVVNLCCFLTLCRRNTSKGLFRSISSRRMSFDRHYPSTTDRNERYGRGLDAEIMIGKFFVSRLVVARRR